jgi:short subunit dehydrogenase-like uncharacterized protein
MTRRVLLYGANGYTGREIAAALAQTDLVLAGRTPDRVRAIADQLGLPWRAFDLADAAGVDAALADIGVVLHAAGPFEETATPMLKGCLRAGAHYLDLGGEWPVFLDLMDADADAKAAGIMVMPGVGLTIAATDCLLAMAAKRWPDTMRLRLGISRAQVITRGSVESASRLVSPDVLIRRSGRLERTPAGRLAHAFDFGEGLVETAAMSWADVVTGEFTTGVSDIEVYSELGVPGRGAYRAAALGMRLGGADLWRRAGHAMAAAWPVGPSAETREGCRFVMVVEALDAWRRPRRLSMSTFDGYTTSVITAAAAVRRVLDGSHRSGFQTPARVFGAEFILEAGAGTLEERKGAREGAPA